MARRHVVEVTCDRCGRTEVQTNTEVTKEGIAEFEGRVPGLQSAIRFNDLCKRCRRSVTNYFDKIRMAPDEEELKEPAKGKTQVSSLAS